MEAQEAVSTGTKIVGIERDVVEAMKVDGVRPVSGREHIEINTGVLVKIDGAIEEEVKVSGVEIRMGRGIIGRIRVEARPTSEAMNTPAYRALKKHLGGYDSIHNITDTWRGRIKDLEDVGLIDDVIWVMKQGGMTVARLKETIMEVVNKYHQNKKGGSMSTKKEEAKKTTVGTAKLKPVRTTETKTAKAPDKKSTAMPAGASDIKGKLHKLNQELGKVGASKEPTDRKAANKARAEIRSIVAESNGTFAIDEFGYAVQVKKTVDRPNKTPAKKEKETRKCPCCGAETKSYFAMGHDAKVKGMFKRILEKKVGEDTLTNDTLRAMYKEYKKNPEQRITEVAKKVMG